MKDFVPLLPLRKMQLIFLAKRKEKPMLIVLSSHVLSTNIGSALSAIIATGRLLSGEPDKLINIAWMITVHYKV